MTYVGICLKIKGLYYFYLISSLWRNRKSLKYKNTLISQAQVVRLPRKSDLQTSLSNLSKRKYFVCKNLYNTRKLTKTRFNLIIKNRLVLLYLFIFKRLILSICKFLGNNKLNNASYLLKSKYDIKLEMKTNKTGIIINSLLWYIHIFSHFILIHFNDMFTKINHINNDR